MDEPLSNLDAKLRVQMRTQVAAHPEDPGHDDALRHPRPDRGDDARRPGRRDARWRRCSRSARRRSSTSRPENLFVAGFIGSPAMNFLPATDRGRQPQQRPGHDPDAGPTSGGPSSRARARRSSSVCGPSTSRTPPSSGSPGATFTVPIDLVESHGFRHLRLLHRRRGEAHSGDLDDLRQGHRSGHARRGHPDDGTARLPRPTSAGQQAELWVNTEKMHVFDVATGANLTAGERRVTPSVTR